MIERNPTPLDPKHVSEIDDIPFAFVLGSGETIASQTVTCSVFRGTDPTPAALLSGAAVIVAGQVVQRVTGGVASTVYTLICTVTTSTGRRLVAAARLPVVDLTAAWS